jgi:hypothetical protein
MATADTDGEGAPATIAELVAGAWDTGGPVYCATKTWFGTGISDAFERLAAQEHLSPAERRAAEQNMRATLPPCRNCGCRQVKKSDARGDSQDDDTPQIAAKVTAKFGQKTETTNENNDASIPAA